VDGKSLRGARRDGRTVHLLAAMEHATRRVLAQRAVNGAPGDVPGFQPLLADLDLAGAVVTADALRTLKAVTVRGFGFPHASQVLQVTRKTRDLHSRRWRTVVVYAVASLAHAQASPARLADLLGGHWSIEDGLHWVRDVTFTEDASQVRSGTAQQVMACLRNLAIGVLCRAGPTNLAAALRFHSRDPHRPLATLGIRLGVGIPFQLPGDDAQAATDSATSKPTPLAERRARWDAQVPDERSAPLADVARSCRPRAARRS
jgi:predicted transposase YbfD/YdcC